MIKIKRNVKKRWKKEIGNQEGSKNKERVEAAKFHSKSEPLRKWLPAVKWFRSHPSSSAKIFAAVKRALGTRVPFRKPVHPFHSCEMAAKPPRLEDPPFHSRSAIWKGFSQLWNHPLVHECHFTAPYTHFAASKWLRNLHALKSFSAHTMKSYHHFGNCWTHFNHLLNSISCIPYVNSMIGKSGVHIF